jgi:hypothetical protein
MRIERKLKLGRLFFSSDDIATFQDIFRLLIKGFSNASFFIKDRDETNLFFISARKKYQECTIEEKNLGLLSKLWLLVEFKV